MRIAALILFVCVTASGDEASRRDQVNAATSDAFNALRREVLSMPISGEQTVAELVRQSNSGEQFDATLQSAEQIGGTRWLDEQTAQVRLEIRGEDIAKALERIAERNSKVVPTSLHALRDRLKKTFSNRTFAATGTSTAAIAADRLRPDVSQIAWRNVSDKDRRAAIDAARNNAISRILDSLGPVELEDGKHLSDVLSTGSVRENLSGWICARPINKIEFRDDLEVRISLSVSPDAFWPALRSSLEKLPAAPVDKGKWQRLREQVETRLVPTVGTAIAQRVVPATGAGLLVIPAEPPAWVAELAYAEGISKSVGGSKLRTARAAQAIALERLRGAINALPLNSTTTLGQAAGADPRISDALTRAVSQARIFKVDYDSPVSGFVRVKMSLDLRPFWHEIASR